MAISFQRGCRLLAAQSMAWPVELVPISLLTTKALNQI